ncbi:MAG: hypothetical protein ACOCQD_04040 [archaeon]
MMKEALQLELPFGEAPSNREVLSDSLKLLKAEAKTQMSIISGQFVLAGIGVGFLVGKTAKFISEATSAISNILLLTFGLALGGLINIINLMLLGLWTLVRNPVAKVKVLVNVLNITFYMIVMLSLVAQIAISSLSVPFGIFLVMGLMLMTEEFLRKMMFRA